MIKKELEIPLRVRKLEALLKRLPVSHPKYIEVQNEYRRRMAGYKGEKSLQYYLSFLSENYFIFHNLRLPDTSSLHYFEIDILLITPSYFLIIDSKNYRGELYFDGQFQQLIQTYEDTKRAYSCPIEQINRHQFQLNRLMEANKLTAIPLDTLVVFTNPSAIITASKNHKQIYKVIRSESFLSKITNFEKKYRKIVYDKKKIQKISRLPLKLHTPNDDNILEHFDIMPNDLIFGVCCPSCDKLPMDRSQRLWHCTSCNHKSKTAHLGAIEDYSLLIGYTITNQKLRDFLCLPSPSAAKYILSSLKLEYKGNLRHRVYFLPPNN